MEFWLGILFVVIAVGSIFIRGNNKEGARRNSGPFLWIGIIAAIIGVIGYVFLGWRF